jgi:hypothetical protein
VISPAGEDRSPGVVETEPVKPTRYRIVVRDRLSERFVQTLDGVVLEKEAEGRALVGDFRDQSELHGVLERLRGRGVELVSLNVVP